MKRRNRILMAAIKNFLARDEVKKATDVLNRIHSVDAAEVIEHVSEPERQIIFNNWAPKASAEALLEMNEHEQVEVAEQLDNELIADILEQMPADDATDLLGDLEEDATGQIISLMKPKAAGQVRRLLKYGSTWNRGSSHCLIRIL